MRRPLAILAGLLAVPALAGVAAASSSSTPAISPEYTWAVGLDAVLTAQVPDQTPVDIGEPLSVTDTATDPGPTFYGPGGTVVGNVIPHRLAMIYGAPDGATVDDINFGQPGGEDAPYQFVEPTETDLRVLSCVVPHTDERATVEASGLAPGAADARVADGTCTVVGAVTANGLPA